MQAQRQDSLAQPPAPGRPGQELADGAWCAFAVETDAQQLSATRVEWRRQEEGECGHPPKLIPYLFPTQAPHSHQAAGSRGPQTHSLRVASVLLFLLGVPQGHCLQSSWKSYAGGWDNVTLSYLHHH